MCSFKKKIYRLHVPLVYKKLEESFTFGSETLKLTNSFSHSGSHYMNGDTFFGGLDLDGSDVGERGDVRSQSSVDLTVGGRVVRDTQLRLKRLP